MHVCNKLYSLKIMCNKFTNIPLTFTTNLKSNTLVRDTQDLLVGIKRLKPIFFLLVGKIDFFFSFFFLFLYLNTNETNNFIFSFVFLLLPLQFSFLFPSPTITQQSTIQKMFKKNVGSIIWRQQTIGKDTCPFRMIDYLQEVKPQPIQRQSFQSTLWSQS